MWVKPYRRMSAWEQFRKFRKKLRSLRGTEANMFDFSFLKNANWGWGCFAEDYMLLIGLVVNLKPRSILEIGTHSGLGAVILAYTGTRYDQNVRVTTMDPNQTLGRSNLHLVPGIERNIEFIEGDSNIVLPEFNRSGRKFDLVFIDGEHEYTQARRDWEHTQNLTQTWVLHDTTQFIGLQRLVQEIRDTNQFDVFQCVSAPGHRKHPNFVKEDFITGLTFIQHRKNLSILPLQGHRDEKGDLLPGHDERTIPNLTLLFPE